MRNIHRRLSLSILVAWTALVLIGAADAGQLMGNAFTCQGRLEDQGKPASATYDLRFTLLDDSGTTLGTDIHEDVAVSGGLFMVELDFGSGAFPGERRFLELAVRPGGSHGSYTVLSPSQPLSPAPYALHAASAETAPWSGLSGLPAGFADGVDQGETYTVGPGLNLEGNELSAAFAGSGSAPAAARSDHGHDSTYVNEAQFGSISSAMIVDGAIQPADLDTAYSLASHTHDTVSLRPEASWMQRARCSLPVPVSPRTSTSTL